MVDLAEAAVVGRRGDLGVTVVDGAGNTLHLRADEWWRGRRMVDAVVRATHRTWSGPSRPDTSRPDARRPDAPGPVPAGGARTDAATRGPHAATSTAHPARIRATRPVPPAEQVGVLRSIACSCSPS